MKVHKVTNKEQHVWACNWCLQNRPTTPPLSLLSQSLALKQTVPSPKLNSLGALVENPKAVHCPRGQGGVPSPPPEREHAGTRVQRCLLASFCGLYDL